MTDIARIKPLLRLIYRHESEGAVAAQGVASAYDVVSAFIPVAHRPKAPLTTYPIREVIEWQAWVVDQGAPSSAAGAGQIIRKTLVGLVANGVAGLGETYGPAVQDRLNAALIEECRLGSFLAGDQTEAEFGDRLARVWASLPVHSDQQGHKRRVRRGESYYQEAGFNEAHASPEEVVAVLRQVREAAPPAADGGDRLAELERRLTALEEWRAQVARASA